MTEVQCNFINAIRKAIGQPYTFSECVDWEEIWKLSKKHHLEAIIYEAAKDSDCVSNELRHQMYETYYKMMAREVALVHCGSEIESAFKSNGIQYAILKGGIIKRDYPVPWMRFMSDMDYYIHPEDRDIIRDVIESIGGIKNGTDSGDENYKLLSQRIAVEFHGRLLYRAKGNRIVQYADWNSDMVMGDSLTEEGFVLNLIGYAVHDLAGSGLGIRYVLDLWIYRNRHPVQPDWEYVNERLRRDGIETVTNNLLDLSECLFADGSSSPLVSKLADYVLQGGLHGDNERGFASEAKNGRLIAILHQVICNKEEFENRYNWVSKYPFLLPMAWIIQLFSSLKNNRRLILAWIKGLLEISNQEAKNQKMFLREIGF